MKLLTLNCHSWLEENAQEKLKILAQEIASGGYDVIALQEVNQSLAAEIAVPDGLYCPTTQAPDIKEDNFALCLAEALQILDADYYWTWCYSHVGYGIYQEGEAILSKNPMIAREYTASKSTDTDSHRTRKNLIAVTQACGQMVEVLSGHFSWWDEGYFSYEWEQTEEILKKNSYPVIIMGDFNNDAGSLGYQRVINSPLQLKDAHTAAKVRTGDHTIVKEIDGWQGNQRPLRIDYIFVAATFMVETCEVVFDGERLPVISDHFGVAAVVQ